MEHGRESINMESFGYPYNKHIYDLACYVDDDQCSSLHICIFSGELFNPPVEPGRLHDNSFELVNFFSLLMLVTVEIIEDVARGSSEPQRSHCSVLEAFTINYFLPIRLGSRWNEI